MLDMEDSEVLRSVLDSLEMGVYLVDRERRICLWNKGAEKLTGYSRSEALGHRCTDNILVHCSESGEVQCGKGCPLRATIEDGNCRQPRMYLRHKAGHRIPVRIRTSVLRNRLGVITGAIESFSSMQADEAEPEGMRPVGAPYRAVSTQGREFVQRRLERSLQMFARDGAKFGLLRVQVDNVAQLRTTRGREAVEALMGVIAETLECSLHSSDVFGRWDESGYLVIAHDTSARALELDADLLRNLVGNAEFRWWGDRVPLTASVGGSMVEAGDSDADLLLRATRALTESIGAGGDRVAITNRCIGRRKGDPCLQSSES